MIKGDKKVIRSWAMFDWANSVYPLVISTAIFPLFYEYVTSPKNPFFKEGGGFLKFDSVLNQDVIYLKFLGIDFINTELFSYAIALALLIVSIISPLLSGIADVSGSKKNFMRLFSTIGSIACVLLFFFDVRYMGLSLIIAMLACIGYWSSLVFYNAYLPEIAEPKDHDRVSAMGFSYGYAGGSILLVLILAGVMSDIMPTKYAFILVGLWWFGFSQLTFKKLPSNVYGKKKIKENKFGKGYRELIAVAKSLNKNKRLKRYLISFFIYSMGVQTIMLMATFFSQKEISWPSDDAMQTGMIGSILLIQFLAIAGAYLIARLAKRTSDIIALAITLTMWIGVCVYALFAITPFHFYVLAAGVGFIMGGIQSLSRSTYSKMLPETEDHASFFSFFDVSEKIGIVIGMLSFGFIEGLTGSMRYSVFALIVFFIIGLAVLLTVPKEKAVA